jgi:hypothetical protein
MMMFWIEFIGSVRAYFSPKNVSFEGKNARRPCFQNGGWFQKPILLSIDPLSDTTDIQEFKKVRRRRQTSCHNSPGLERTSVESSFKKAVSKKTNVRTSREGSEDRKYDEEKRIKITPRKHMCTCTESEPDTSELIKSNDRKKDYTRGKRLR